MRLRHIEVFHAIMQVGTISGAAQVLHVTQSAVTKVLQHCELQLGMPLFERVRGKLYPKPEAHRLFIETEKLNRELLAIRRLAVSLKAKAVETIRLVSTPTIATSILPRAMNNWRDGVPNTRCELATQHTLEMVNTLRLGEADFGLSLQDPRHPGIEAQPIAKGVMHVIAPSGRWSSKHCGMPFTVKDLTGELIMLESNDPLVGLVADTFEAHDVQPLLRTTVQTYQIARAMVEAGSGMAVVDPFTAACAHKELVQRRPFAPEIPIQMYVLTASNAPLSQASGDLVKCIANVAKACVADVAR